MHSRNQDGVGGGHRGREAMDSRNQMMKQNFGGCAGEVEMATRAESNLGKSGGGGMRAGKPERHRKGIG